ATIRTEYVPVADELSQILVFDPPRNVVITGHTDNVPISTAQFPSNWSLSVMRSVNFLQQLMASNPQLDPKYFSAKGYGENKPVDTNDTDEGRAKNRRVEVLIQPRVLEDGTVTMEDEQQE
ncbi:MAG TPA: OmpA family protein, partial [Metalysinibacillus sp.]